MKMNQKNIERIMDVLQYAGGTKGSGTFAPLISFGLQVCLVCAGFDTLGDVIKLSKKEVAKVNGIAPFLRELDSLVWRSGLDYQSDK